MQWFPHSWATSHSSNIIFFGTICIWEGCFIQFVLCHNWFHRPQYMVWPKTLSLLGHTHVEGQVFMLDEWEVRSNATMFYWCIRVVISLWDGDFWCSLAAVIFHCIVRLLYVGLMWSLFVIGHLRYVGFLCILPTCTSIRSLDQQAKESIIPTFQMRKNVSENFVVGVHTLRWWIFEVYLCLEWHLNSPPQMSDGL